ncbi:MAG: hypothetical protein ACQETL_19430 [Bacteroidota bacterium]
MENFVKFVHFVNSEKKFIFKNTVSPELALTKEEYVNHPNDGNKLLRYNGLTYKQFMDFLETNEDIVKNEISDVFHKQNKAEVTELLNKYKLLVQLQKKYKSKSIEGEKYQLYNGLIVHYPEKVINNFNELQPAELKNISNFLKLEFEFLYEIVSLIQKLDKEYSFNKILGGKDDYSGFKFNTMHKIEFPPIYFLLQGNLIDCDMETFKKVFDGRELKRPPKIKWLLNYRKDSNKRALIYFLSQPIFVYLDEEELKQKILYCFCDSQGYPFKLKSLNQNFSDYNKHIEKIESESNKKDWKVLIDEKVAVIQQYLQS